MPGGGHHGSEKLKEMIVEFSKIVGVPVDDILGRSRKRHIVDARHLYWKLLREKSGLSFPRIAMLNERTSCTVLHGVDKTNGLLSIGDKVTCRMWNMVKGIEYDRSGRF